MYYRPKRWADNAIASATPPNLRHIHQAVYFINAQSVSVRWHIFIDTPPIFLMRRRHAHQRKCVHERVVGCA